MRFQMLTRFKVLEQLNPATLFSIANVELHLVNHLRPVQQNT